MKPQKKRTLSKNEYKKGFDLKLSIIDQISNGQISLNHASKLHGISQLFNNLLDEKLRSFEQNSTTEQESRTKKNLKTYRTEFIKDFQQMIIADFEVSTNLDFAKKSHCPALLKRSGEKRKTF
jgi:hypothetical protein